MIIRILFTAIFLLAAAQILKSQTCITATAIKSDTIVIDTFGFIGNHKIPCYGQINLTTGKWFTIKGEDEIFEIKAFSGFVYVLEGDCGNLKCISSNSNKYFLDKGKDYFIVVGHPAYELGLMSHFVSFRKIPSSPSQMCSSSELLNCGEQLEISTDHIFSDTVNKCHTHHAQTIWFKLKGDGNIANLKFQGANYLSITIQEGIDCSQFKCSSYKDISSSFSFVTQTETYYLVTVQPKEFVGENFMVSLNCEKSEIGYSCELAEIFGCGQNISAEKYAGAELYTLADGQFVKGKWYELAQKDTTYKIGFTLPIENPGYDILKIYQSDEEKSCKDLNLISVTSIQSGLDVVVEASKSKRTFLVFDFLHPQYATIQCSPLQSECSDAIPVYDGLESVITRNVSKKEYINSVGGKYNFHQWFKLSKDDFIVDFSILLDSPFNFSNMDFAILEGDCENFRIIREFESTDILNRRLLISDLPDVENKSYYIACGMKDFYNQVKLKFSKYVDNEAGANCLNPLEISINKMEWGNIPQYTTVSDFNAKEYQFLSGNYWCKVKGNGEIFNIHVDQNSIKELIVYEGGCGGEYPSINSRLYLNSVEHLSFKSMAGVDYYILVYPNLQTSNYRIKLPFVTTSKQVQNSNCEGAEELACNIPLEGVNIGAYNSFNPQCQNTGNLFWYSIPENSNKIDWREFIDQTNFNVRVYKGDCENLQCLPLQFNQTSINIDSNQKYFLTITPEIPLNSVFKFGVNCSVPLSGGSSCSKPMDVSCGGEYTIDFTQGAFAYNLNFVNINEFWIKIVGDGKLANFSFTGFALSEYSVYSECDSLIFSAKDLLGTNQLLNGKFSVLIPKGSEYKIKLYAFDYNIGKMIINCVEPVPNYNCNQAKEIQCGDDVFIT